MPAVLLNFRQCYADAVQVGRKQQTIRVRRKAQVGDTAHLVANVHTHRSRKLGIAPITEITPIEIGRHADGEPFACIHDIDIHEEELDTFAHADGFASGEALVSYFEATHGLPFKGWLHRWKLPEN